MDNTLIDLMECPLGALQACIPTMNREVAMSTIKMRQQREAEKIRRAFTGNLYHCWIPENCKKGHILTYEQIDTLNRMCMDVLQAQATAVEQVANLFAFMQSGLPKKMEIAAKAD